MTADNCNKFVENVEKICNIDTMPTCSFDFYNNVAIRIHFTGYEFIDYLNELLDKQIPRKVKWIKFGTDIFKDPYCPTCLRFIDDDSRTYCNCGQKLDWSE